MIYTCSCGEPYLIGNCGHAWVVGKCSSCGRETGGHDHQPVANQTQMGLAREADQQSDSALLGMPPDVFDEAPSHTERDMNPIQYRILIVLQLMCIAVAERTVAFDARKRQLEQHWGVLRDLFDTNDSDTQLLLAMLIDKCGPDLTLPELVLTGFGTSLTIQAANAVWARGESMFCNILSSKCPEILDQDGRNELLKAAAERISEGHSLADVRESAIEVTMVLNPERATRDFAPSVLTIQSQSVAFWSICEPDDKSVGQVCPLWKEYNAMAKFPLLQAIANTESKMAESAKIVGSKEFLKLLGYLSLLHRQLDGKVSEASTETLATLLGSCSWPSILSGQGLESLIESWEACRQSVQAFQCQALDSGMPPITKDTLVSDVIVSSNRSGEPTMAYGLLAGMAEAFNKLTDDYKHHLPVSLYVPPNQMPAARHCVINLRDLKDHANACLYDFKESLFRPTSTESQIHQQLKDLNGVILDRVLCTTVASRLDLSCWPEFTFQPETYNAIVKLPGLSQEALSQVMLKRFKSLLSKAQCTDQVDQSECLLQWFHIVALHVRNTKQRCSHITPLITFFGERTGNLQPGKFQLGFLNSEWCEFVKEFLRDAKVSNIESLQTILLEGLNTDPCEPLPVIFKTKLEHPLHADLVERIDKGRKTELQHIIEAMDTVLMHLKTHAAEESLHSWLEDTDAVGADEECLHLVQHPEVKIKHFQDVYWLFKGRL